MGASHRKPTPDPEKKEHTALTVPCRVAVLVFPGLAGWAEWERLSTWCAALCGPWQLSRRGILWKVAASHCTQVPRWSNEGGNSPLLCQLGSQ